MAPSLHLPRNRRLRNYNIIPYPRDSQRTGEEDGIAPGPGILGSSPRVSGQRVRDVREDDRQV